jgi:ADP-ribose pyrophosphatase
LNAEPDADERVPGPEGEVDAHLSESRLDSEQVFDGHFLKVYRDTVRLPGGGTAHREFIRHPGAVMIVPIDDRGRLVLERQFRYPLDGVLLEFPAGKIDPGESTFECARRELLEETGLSAREWALAGRMHNTPAYSDEFIEMWFARGLVQGEQRLDDGEFIEVVRMDPADLEGSAARGEITDAKTLVALLKLQQWRSGAWTPSWQTCDCGPP